MEIISCVMPLKACSLFCHVWKMQWVMIIHKIFSELFTILGKEKMWTLLSSPAFGMKVTKMTTVCNSSFSPFTPLKDLNAWRLHKAWRGSSPIGESETNKKAMCPVSTSRNYSEKWEIQDCNCTFPALFEAWNGVCWTEMLLETHTVGLLELWMGLHIESSWAILSF